jgi:hypothetical protein
METSFSKDSMREKMEQILSIARFNLESHGFLIPAVMLLKNDEKGELRVSICQLDYKDESRKKATTTAMMVKMAMDKVDAYIMITEAWTKPQEKGEPITRPSEDPDRQEGICISAGTPMLSLSLTQIFHRAENGNGPKYEYEEESFCETTESTFYPQHWRNKN